MKSAAADAEAAVDGDGDDLSRAGEDAAEDACTWPYLPAYGGICFSCMPPPCGQQDESRNETNFT